MTGLHVTVSTAWLADRLRATAARIRSIPTDWFNQSSVAAELDILAAELDAVVSFPPPVPVGAGTLAITAPPSLAEELTTAVRDVQTSLRRAPYEPTVEDLLEVLAHRLQFGTLPLRKAPEPPGSATADGRCIPDLCPLGTAIGHSHSDGHLIWA